MSNRGNVATKSHGAARSAGAWSHRWTRLEQRLFSPEWLRIELLLVAAILVMVARFDVGVVGSYLRNFFGLLFR